MNPSVRHNVELHFSEIEGMLVGLVEKKIKEVKIACKSKELKLYKVHSTQTDKLFKTIAQLKHERDCAIEDAEAASKATSLAETSLKDGQAYCRQIGRELEELKKERDALPIS